MADLATERRIEEVNSVSGRRLRQLVGGAVWYVVLIAVSLFTIFPFLWMVSASLMARNDSIVFPPKFFPYFQFQPTLVEYEYLFSDWLRSIMPFDRYLFNSFYIAGVVVVGRVLVCALGGYAFARLSFPGKGLLFGMLMASLLVPGVVRLIPLYHGYKFLGVLNTHFPLIVPAIVANTFGTFLMRQFFMTIPKELEEAARIDGSSTFGIFWRIAVPLSKPVIATLAIFTFQGSWNDFTTPVIYIDDIKKTTLPVGLSVFSGEFSTEYEKLMAGATVGLLPILVVYSFAQRYFVQGIALTGIKG